MSPEKRDAVGYVYSLFVEAIRIARRHRLEIVVAIRDPDAPASDPQRLLCMANADVEEALKMLGEAQTALTTCMSKSAHEANNMLDDLLKGRK